MTVEAASAVRRRVSTCTIALWIGFLAGAAGVQAQQVGPLVIGAQVNVTPDGIGTSAAANSTGNTATFTVQNTGTVNGVFNLTCSWTANVTGCTVQSTVSVGAGTSQNVNVTYSAGAVGQGTVTLQASTTGSSDTGYFVVTIQSYGVAVTPDGTTVTKTANTSGLSQAFTVKNNGSATATFNLTATCTSPASGCSAPTSVSVGSGAQSNVTVATVSAPRAAAR